MDDEHAKRSARPMGKKGDDAEYKQYREKICNKPAVECGRDHVFVILAQKNGHHVAAGHLPINESMPQSSADPTNIRMIV